MDITSGAAIPGWMQVSILLTLLWPVIGPSITRRDRDVRLFSVIPFVFAICAGSLGLVRAGVASRGLNHATNFLTAEAAGAVIVVLTGAILTIVIGAATLAMSSLADATRRSSAITLRVLIAAFVGLGLFLGEIAMLRMFQGRIASREVYCAWIVFAYSIGVFIVTLVSVVLPIRRFVSSTRASFYTYVMVSAAATGLLGVVLGVLRRAIFQ